MSCCSGEGLVIVMVTLPDFAFSSFLSNFSCCGSAASASWVPPPPPEAAVDVDVDVDVELAAELDELLLLDPPQPASATSATAPRMSSRFMVRTLPPGSD